MFLFANLLTTIYSKTVIIIFWILERLASHWVPKFQRSFCLTEISETCDWLKLGKFCCHQSTRVYFKGRAYIKIILRNQARSYYWVGLIIGKTRYEKEK